MTFSPLSVPLPSVVRSVVRVPSSVGCLLSGVQEKINCSRHGFLYIRGWMQMVLASNDLFSWNKKYNKYNVTNTFTHFLLELCTWTHSVHARILKPWRGSLPWLPAISSSCHVFPLPLSGLTWRSLFPPGGPGPPPSKMAPLFTGSAHTPLPGSRTLLLVLTA